MSKKKEIKTKNKSLTIDVFDTQGKVVGKVQLPKEIFGAKVNDRLMAQAVRVYAANQRQGTSSTKTRGEVRGSTRKIYRQKGTGRARHGSIRAPIFVHGGIVFGPKPRSFSLKLSKRMRRAALFSAITARLKEKAIHVIQGLEKIEPKTKKMAKVLSDNNLPLRDRTLLVLPKNIENVKRAAGNIEGLDLTLAKLLNTFEILSHRNLLLMKDSIKEMEKIWMKF